MFKKNTYIVVMLALFIFFIPQIIFSEVNEEKNVTAPEDTSAKGNSELPKNWYDGLIFNDKSFVFEFIRAMGYSYEGGADIGECIDTARRIKDGDDTSWYNEWLITAARIFKFAQKMEKEDNSVTAKEAYLRASNYYRAAGFYMHSKANLPKALLSWKKSKGSFLKAIPFIPNIEVINIPYQDTLLPGYFMKTLNSKEKKPPLLIVHTGFDGTAEELFFEVGLAAIRRGYNCLIFEGPGQGQVIRIQKIPFRYDWEKVVTPVVDYALTRPDVNKEKIALMGISMGGYLAPRAVAFEHRIKVCIANSGVYDFSAGFYNGFPKELIELLKKDPEKFNAEIEGIIKEDAGARWYFNNGMFTFKAENPADFVSKLPQYTLKDVVKRIKCNMLVIDGEGDMFVEGQAKKLYSELNCPKEYILFTRRQTAQAHCQMGATAISNEVIFNWLDKVFSSSFSRKTQHQLEQVVEKNLAECQGIKNIPNG